MYVFCSYNNMLSKRVHVSVFTQKIDSIPWNETEIQFFFKNLIVLTGHFLEQTFPGFRLVGWLVGLFCFFFLCLVHTYI